MKIKTHIKGALFIALMLLGAISCQKDKSTDPDSSLVTTEGPFLITHVGATVQGDYQGEDSDLRERGICYSTSPNPTSSSTKRTSGVVPNVNTTWNMMAGQSPDTKYYARAYAITKEGKTHYGKEVTFTTLPLFSSPVFTNDSFKGNWKSSSGSSPSMVLAGSSTGLNYHIISSGSVLNALNSGFIKLGDYYIKNLVKQGNGWKADVQWRRYYASSEQVLEVKYSPNSTIVMNSDGKSFTISSTSPWDSSLGTITFYRE